MIIEQAPRAENPQLEQNRRHALMRLGQRLQAPKESFLRENQMSMVQALHAFLQTGKTSGYMSEPTGSGKTAVILEIANLLGLKTVVLSPTKQILRQTHGKSQEFTPDLDLTNYYANEKNLKGQVVNTTYQSMLRFSRKQNEDLKPEEVGLVICDEADLALGEETHTIFRKFPNAIKIGMTATPYFDPILGYKQRGIVKEGEEWTGLFTNLIHEMSLEEGMERGIVIGNADIHLIRSSVAVSDIRIHSNDEYANADVKKFFDKASRNMLAIGMVAGLYKLPKDVNLSEDQKREIDIIHNKIKGKKTFIFAIDIDHADALVEQLSEKGISVAAIHGKIDGKGSVLEAHKKGEIQVLVGVDILGRGVDSPPTEIAIHLRPTRSGRILAQQFGRVLRLSPETEKEKATSIQIVDQFTDRTAAPVLISDLFDPGYVLRGAATGEKPSEAKSAQLHERPIVTFSGMNIDFIIEEAKARDLLKTRFKQGSIAEISNFFQKLVEDAGAKNSKMGLYELFKTIVDSLPQRMPFESYEKAMQAITSVDTNTRVFGKKVLLFLNFKTLLSVVNSFYIEEIDSLEEKDEMLTAVVAYVMGKMDKGMTVSAQVSGRINRTARDGIIEFLRDKYDMPAGLIRDPQDKLFVLTKVREEFENEFSTKDSIENLANELNVETGVDKEEILNWLMFLNAGRESERKKLSLEQGEDARSTIETSELKEQMERCLGTIKDSEKRVLELRFGLEDGRQRTLEEIGRYFGVTKERIRVIEDKALRRLRHPTRSKLLRGYLGTDDIGYLSESGDVPLPAVRKKKQYRIGVDFSVNRSNLDGWQKRLLVGSGIRKIGDFFSAAPEELMQEWLGSPKELAAIIKNYLGPTLDNLNYKLLMKLDLTNEEMALFIHITDSISYRQGRGVRFKIAMEDRMKMYEKGYKDIKDYFRSW